MIGNKQLFNLSLRTLEVSQEPRPTRPAPICNCERHVTGERNLGSILRSLSKILPVFAGLKERFPELAPVGIPLIRSYTEIKDADTSMQLDVAWLIPQNDISIRGDSK